MAISGLEQQKCVHHHFLRQITLILPSSPSIQRLLTQSLHLFTRFNVEGFGCALDHGGVIKISSKELTWSIDCVTLKQVLENTPVHTWLSTALKEVVTLEKTGTFTHFPAKLNQQTHPHTIHSSALVGFDKHDSSES